MRRSAIRVVMVLIWPAGRRGRCSFDSVEPRGKGGVLAAMKAVGTWKYEKDP